MGLKIENLVDIQNEIWEARVKWYQIGLELKLIAPDLDAIESNGKNVEKRFTEMISQWLRKGKNCTWRAIVDALSSCTVNEAAIAETVQKEHCPKVPKIDKPQGNLKEELPLCSPEVPKIDKPQGNLKEELPAYGQVSQKATPIPAPKSEHVSMILCAGEKRELYLNEDAFKLREYQKELADPGIKGSNYILVAPTGTGKTLIAAYIIMHHLNRMRERCIKGKIAFVTPTQQLTSQQRVKLEQYITGIVAVEVTGASGKAMRPQIQSDQVDIIVCTSGKLRQELIAKKTNQITDFSLIIADECHHAGRPSCYTDIMELYIRQKIAGHPSLPQVIGMTASPGAGKGKTYQSVYDHQVSLCATLDATAGIFTVRENVDELKSVCNAPKPYLEVEIERDPDDPFIIHVTSAMEQLESFINSDPCKGKDLKEHELWLQKRKAAEENECSVLKQLTVYLQSLKTYCDYQYDDAMGVLEEEFQHQNHSAELRKKLTDDHTELMRKLADVPKIPNPMLKRVESILCKQFLEIPESKGIFFVEEAKQTEYIKKWINNTPSLSGIISVARIAGSGHMIQSQQKKILEGFRNDTYNLLASTAVLEEGFDVPQCNFIIRYQKVSNEISQVQTRGRARAENSRIYTVVSTNSRKDYWYLVQDEKERMVDISILELQEKFTGLEQLIHRKQSRFIEICNCKEEEMKKHKRKWPDTEYIEVLCRQCGVLACKGSDLFTYSLSCSDLQNDLQYVVPNATFSNKYTRTIHDKPEVSNLKDFIKPYRIYCCSPNCRKQWGVIGFWRETDYRFPVLKCESFCFRYKGDTQTISWKKWKKICFEVKNIHDWNEFEEDINEEKADAMLM